MAQSVLCLFGLVLGLLGVAEGPPAGAELLANLAEGKVGLLLEDGGPHLCNKKETKRMMRCQSE